MRYSGILFNDVSAAPGISVSVFLQGCPHHCPGCQNPETWDFDGGKEFRPEVLDEICEKLTINGIKRNLCIMGGEPLCPDNLFLTHLIVSTVKQKLPDIKVYIWTGYLYEEIAARTDSHTKAILGFTDCIVDGPFIQELRDITLPMRGSSNQRIIDLAKKI